MQIEPIGVAVLVTAGNAPIPLLAKNLAPALAACAGVF
jgi:acyl-CoA reductase-like NAD-dependent aldehyde dehydrogenase